MKKVRFGMIGGGRGAFIGAVHRTAANIAGNLELVAGALSTDGDRAVQSGLDIGLTESRAYRSIEEMIAKEAQLPADQRIEAVSIVTPNHAHAPAAIAALAADLHVICDKPLADTEENAAAMIAAAQKTDRIFAVTHTYTGYPLVQQAREMVASGRFGKVRRIIVKYTQDWLSRVEDGASSKQAAWRIDPKQAGIGGAFGDIGTHAFNLAEYISAQPITHVLADLGALEGRVLDDDGSCLFKLADGGKGVLVASQVCVGDANDLTISVYCDEGALHWRQEEPNKLLVGQRDKPTEIWTAGSNRSYVNADIAAMQRTPAGHPEGYLEAFANIYRAFADDVRSGQMPARPGYATLDEAMMSMRFVGAARKSADNGNIWVEL